MSVRTVCTFFCFMLLAISGYCQTVKVEGEEQTWQEVFLQDIRALEEAGITHADFKKV